MAAAQDDILSFEDDLETDQKNSGNDGGEPWHLLVVDDDPEVHSVTRLALKGFSFAGRKLQIDSAYSGQEARQKMQENQYAIALLDVVMETEHAGLELAQWIRENLDDSFVRLILRTGQPGQAPERDVISNYDINDYKEKTELTSNKLFTLIYSSLRAYRDIVALYKNKIGLETVIKSSAHLHSHQSFDEFTQGALEQLTALLHVNTGALYSELHGLAAEHSSGDSQILAGTGRFSGRSRVPIQEVVSESEWANIQPVLINGGQTFGDDYFVGVYNSKMGRQYVLFIDGFERLSEIDKQLVQIFGQNIGVAFDSQSMFEEVELTQREMVYRLSEAVESRSKETSNHVKRMALTCRVIGKAYGLDDRQVEILYKAAPLHDIGKIAIPDHILNKPGKLTAEEWEVMKSHAQIGHDILASSELEVLRAGAIIAGGHHENWDGSGYPRGQVGEQIPVFARVAAVADVFDALVNKRCYKDSWSLDEALNFFIEMKGVKFEPALVDLLFEQKSTLMEIQAAHAD